MALSLNNLEFSFWSSVRPNVNCNVTLGPSDCPAYGTPFTGSDNQTECKACTLACHNLALFKDSKNKSTCKFKYYNYGCHKKYLCVDERAKFEAQYSAAVSFCVFYNGCIVQKKYTKKAHQDFIDKKIKPEQRKFVKRMLDFEAFTYEDMRALIMQSTQVRHLLRFKLAQDMIDARVAAEKNGTNTTFNDFIRATNFKNLNYKLPDYIASSADAKYFKAQAQNVWDHITYVPFDFLPESFFYKYINAWSNLTYTKFQFRKDQLKTLKDKAEKYNQTAHDKHTGNRDRYHDLAQNATEKYKKYETEVKAEQVMANFQIRLFSKISGRIYDFFILLADKLVKRAKSPQKIAQMMNASTFSDVSKFAMAQKKNFIKLFKTDAMKRNAGYLYDAMLLPQDVNGNSYDDSMSYQDIVKEQALQDAGCSTDA